MCKLKTKLLCETSSISELDNIKNAAILRDTLNFLNLTTSKAKGFCEMSSIFELDNIKNEAILRDFLQKWKVECRADGLVPILFRTNTFCVFLNSICIHLSKVLRLPRKKWCQVIQSAAPVTKNHLSKPEDPMLQNATLLRKSAPWPPNISNSCVSCTAPATRNTSLQILFKCPTPAFVFESATKPSRFADFWPGAQSATRKHIWTSKQKWSVPHSFLHFWLQNVLRATTACTFSACQLPKVLREWCVLRILTSKCASGHNRAHFFDMSTSPSAPRMVCFVHFDFETCFAPQRRALFRHLNFQEWSENGVLCTFWLRNVLRATTACYFSFLIWPDGSARTALASLLFDQQIIGKTLWIATFLPFPAPAFSFFWIFLFPDLLSSSLLFSSLTLPTCPFPSVDIVGSLTSKFPSRTYIYIIFLQILTYSYIFLHWFYIRTHTLHYITWHYITLHYVIFYLHYICIIFTLSLQYIYNIFTLYLHYIYIICTLYLHYIFTLYSHYIYIIFTVYSHSIYIISHHIYSIFTLCLHYTYTIFALHLHDIFTLYLHHINIVFAFYLFTLYLHDITLHLHLHYITLLYVTLQTVHNITEHYITFQTLHCITSRCITLHYGTVHVITYITLHYITWHYITLHYITVHYITLHYGTLHYITLRCITLHHVALHCITLHYIALRCITLHYIALYCITLHYITLHT